MRRPKRSPSSATLAAQNARARADFYASAESPDVLASLRVLVDDEGRRELIRCALRDAFQAGGEREADMRTAVDASRVVIDELKKKNRALAARVAALEAMRRER